MANTKKKQKMKIMNPTKGVKTPIKGKKIVGGGGGKRMKRGGKV